MRAMGDGDMLKISWPDAVAGFVLGLLPVALRQIYILVHHFRAPARRKYLGVFWSYHRTTRGTGEIRQSRVDISFSLLRGRLIVSQGFTGASDSSPDGLTYVGHVSKREGMVRYFFLRDESSHEQQMWILIDPFQTPFDTTIGVFLALDARGLPVAGLELLSRRQLTLTEADRLLVSTVLRVDPVPTF